MAAWSPAFSPTKDVDYFGSEKLPIPDSCMPGWLRKHYGHFPEFFLLKAVLFYATFPLL